MKQLTLLIIACFFSSAIFAQTPQAISYQAIARNATGVVLASQSVGIKISIHTGSVTGTVEYSETHHDTTNQFGLFTLQIGNGTPAIGTFSTIDWSTGNKFLQVELDPTGGTTYIDMGTSQLLSVPYALYAEKSNINLQAGNGIQISGDTIINSSPNIPVSITGSGDVTVSGTYPNFNVDGTPSTFFAGTGIQISNDTIINSSPDIPVTIVGTGGTTVSGSYPDFTIFSTSNAWNLTGNAGTNSSTNFIGTTDNTSLIFKVNNENAGRIDPTPLSNTSLGYHSMNANTTGSYNTAIGVNALNSNATANNNSAYGFQSLLSNTTGNDNTANGANSLNANTTGSYITATGYQALMSNTTGGDNSAFGVSALASNLTGGFNTATGNNSLSSNTIGNYNTANGWRALFLSTGSNNTASGMKAIYNNTIGNDNTAFGYTALITDTTGFNNTALGSGADVTTGGLHNATAIGYNAKVSASNSLILGGTGVNAVNVGIGVSNPTVLLDIRQPFSGALNCIRFGDYNKQAYLGAGNDIFGLADNNGINRITVVQNTGNVSIGTNINAMSKLHVFGGDVNIDDIGAGVIIKSPNGQCWRISVSNAGVLSATSIVCP